MKRRTAKGDMVDFDLIKVKAQMGQKPAPPEVSQRQEIIDRRLRKKATAMTPSPINNTPKRPIPPKVSTPPKVSAPPEVLVDEEIKLDIPDDNETSESTQPKPKRRQKTKPKNTSGDENADTTN